jgi:hypothetical protein
MEAQRLAHARSRCRLSPLGQAIGERFVDAYLEEPSVLVYAEYRRAYVAASEHLLRAPEGSPMARQARREMYLHAAALWTA